MTKLLQQEIVFKVIRLVCVRMASLNEILSPGMHKLNWIKECGGGPRRRRRMLALAGKISCHKLWLYTRNNKKFKRFEAGRGLLNVSEVLWRGVR